MRHLVALADHGHFGRAAEACYVMQSTMSASLKELEFLLDEKLVERTKRSVAFTPLGLKVAEKFRKILIDLDDVVDLVASRKAPLSGPLRLGVIPTISPYLVPRILPKLKAAYPDLELYLREEQTETLLEKLKQADLDAALLGFPYPTPRMEVEPISNDPFFVLFPNRHRFREMENVHWRDIRNEELLLLEEGHCLGTHVLSACHLEDSEFGDSFRATSLGTLVQMVAGGLGITLLPKMAVDAGLANIRGLSIRPLLGRGNGRDIGLVWRKTSSRSAEYTLIAEIIREELALPVKRSARRQ